MVTKLTRRQINEVLECQRIGRLGCHNNGKTYVVPINYVYYCGYIYGYSREGTKISMMRKNPKVCFQVDDLKDAANWRSVVVWGVFEELTEEKERNKALQILVNHPLALISSLPTHDQPGWPFSSVDPGSLKGVVYRIGITEKTGRHEQNVQTPLLAAS